MTTGARKRVLVMDDSAIILETVREALADVGFEVDTAADLAELERCAGAPHDLILLDVNMPDVLGDDLTARLRQKQSVEPKIFLLSSMTDDALQSRAAECHIDGYISKRWGVDVVVQRVQEILGIHDAAAS